MTNAELRIGNWIQRKSGVITQVREVLTTKIGIDSEPPLSIRLITVPITSVRLIPLTEEWVIKFGFKDGGQTSVLYKIFKISKSDIAGYDVHAGNMFCTITKQEANVNLQYVHQLQNLYFALTGTELYANP